MSLRANLFALSSTKYGPSSPSGETVHEEFAVVVVVVLLALAPPPQPATTPAPATAKMPITCRRLISLFLFFGDISPLTLVMPDFYLQLTHDERIMVGALDH
jgi:hypothetical protein